MSRHLIPFNRHNHRSTRPNAGVSVEHRYDGTMVSTERRPPDRIDSRRCPQQRNRSLLRQSRRHGAAETPTYAPTIENWIRWYLAHLNRPTANGAPPDVWNLGYTIYNYNVDSQSNEVSTNMADSTDSYAAMFLSLVWQYYSGGGARAQSFVHGLSASDLNGIAQVMIKTQQPNGLTIAKTDYTIEYLMDNSEVYRGLRDAASLFHFVFNDDAHAQAYNDAADKVRQGILGVLWDAPNGTFAISNDVSIRRSLATTGIPMLRRSSGLSLRASSTPAIRGPSPPSSTSMRSGTTGTTCRGSQSRPARPAIKPSSTHSLGWRSHTASES